MTERKAINEISEKLKLKHLISLENQIIALQKEYNEINKLSKDGIVNKFFPFTGRDSENPDSYGCRPGIHFDDASKVARGLANRLNKRIYIVHNDKKYTFEPPEEAI